MEKSDSNKTILFLIVIIFILAIILGIKILKPNNKVDSYFKFLSPEEIKEKIIAGLNYNNYTISCKINGVTRIKKIKDGIIVVTEPSTGVYGWNDSNTRVSISGNTVKNKYVNVPVVDDSMFNKHFILIEMNLKDYGDNLYHIKNEKYHNKNCHVINAGKDRNETYWIDAEKGFIEKYEASDGTKLEFTFELDNVTDDDIKKPIP